jgi:hypothetical protein
MCVSFLLVATLFRSKRMIVCFVFVFVSKIVARREGWCLGSWTFVHFIDVGVSIFSIVFVVYLCLPHNGRFCSHMRNTWIPSFRIGMCSKFDNQFFMQLVCTCVDLLVCAGLSLVSYFTLSLQASGYKLHDMMTWLVQDTLQRMHTAHTTIRAFNALSSPVIDHFNMHISTWARTTHFDTCT